MFAQEYNIAVMFEIIDLYIETHLNLKQIYLLDFSLQDAAMKEILKPKIAEMENLLKEQREQIALVLEPITIGGQRIPEFVLPCEEERLEEQQVKKKDFEERSNKIMLEIRKKVIAEPLTAQDIEDYQNGVVSLSTEDIVRTDISDRALADSKVSTTEQSYKKWI